MPKVTDRRLGNFALEFDPMKVDAIFKDLDQCERPGAAVGIAINGHPVYRRGFGLAHMELPVLLSPSIRMRIGSTTKHFTSLAYLLLCEDGKAALDDRIGDILPELHPSAHEITVRQLMSHVSGLRDAYDIFYQLNGIETPVSSSALLDLYKSIDDHNAPSGHTWVYNNGGYLILTALIERIAAEPLETVLRERIFEPVGMHDSLLRRMDIDFVANSATLHMPAGEGGFEKRHLGADASGSGAVVSTVDDMLRWLAHMDAPKVGSAESWKLMMTPQQLANGTSTHYGLGLMIDRYRGVATVGHAGGVLGGNSAMLKVPEVGLDIVVMLNRGDVSAILLTEKILDACLTNLEPVSEVAASTHQPSSGVFRSCSTGRLVELFVRGADQMASIDGMDMPLTLGADGALRPSGAWRFQKYEIRIAGLPPTPAAISFCDFGNSERLEAVEVDHGVPVESVEGRYFSRSTGTEVIIERRSDGARLTTLGTFGSVEYRLESLTPDIWRVKPLKEAFTGGLVSFSEGASGFSFSTFRTVRLLFTRRA